MSAYDKDFIDQVRERADVVDVVGRRVELKKAGREFSALCPFHNEKSPSFSVSPTKQFYHCFGCGAHGNAIDFLVEYDGMSFVDAIELLARESGIAIPQRSRPTPEAEQRKKRGNELIAVLVRAKEIFRNNLRTHRHAVDYMKQRGLEKDAVMQFGLGYAHNDISAQMGDVPSALLIEAGLMTANSTGEMYDKFRQRVMFPIHNEQGNIIGFGGRVLNDSLPKYMNSPESQIFQKGSELFGLYFAKQEIRRTRTALLLEGYMDVIMLHQHGDPRAVAALGTSLTEQQVSRLYRMCDEIVFCFDGDKAGRAASDRAAKIVLTVMPDGKSAKFLTLPQDHDPDSYVREFGIEEWKRAVSEQGIPLSGKITRILTAGRDIDLPEVKAAIAKEAEELLATVRDAPTFKGALRAHIERLLGFKVKAKMSRVPTRVNKPAQLAPVTPMVKPNVDRMGFYQNFALLCGLSCDDAADVNEALVDEFATLVSSWFCLAPPDLQQRIALAENIRLVPLRFVVQDALNRIKERLLTLPADALQREAKAINQAISRDAERLCRASKAAALFGE